MIPGMRAWATAFGGFATCLIGWVLPMIVPTLPHWIKIAVLCAGVALLVLSAVLGWVGPRSKRDKASISVKMRDRNTIGRIGSNYDGK